MKERERERRKLFIFYLGKRLLRCVSCPSTDDGRSLFSRAINRMEYRGGEGESVCGVRVSSLSLSSRSFILSWFRLQF